MPATPIRAYVGGLPATVSAYLSPNRPGEFDVKIRIPAGAQPGDIVTVVGNRASNLLTYGTAPAVSTSFVPMPDGAPEIRSLTASDLRGGFAIASGARDANGCYPSILFDLSGQTAVNIDACLTSANRNAPSPVTRVNEGSALGAFIGPPSADATNGVSSTVAVFAPGNSLTVQLPSPGVFLGSSNGNLMAVLAGTPTKAVEIDSSTGALTDVAPGVGIGGGGGGGGAGFTLGAGLNIDLGNGLNKVLSITLAGQAIYAVVGDDADAPTAAKLALLNFSGAVQSTSDFPSGWLPLLAAKAPTPTGGGGAGPGANIRPRGTATYDAATRTLYVLGRAADSSKDAIIAFGPANTSAIALPSGWFAASCTVAIPLQQLTLSRRFAFVGTNVVEKDLKATCPGLGHLLFDYSTQKVEAIPLSGDGQITATAANSEINDYLYGTNTDPSRSGTLSTVYVLDGVTRTSFRLDLPSGVQGFSNLQALPALSSLIALGRNKTAGDAGVILFDLDAGTALPPFPVPDGFSTVQIVDVFATTRKLVASGTLADGSGSRYLIYDLLTGDLTMVQNPAGVAFVGSVPAAGGGRGPGGGGAGGGAASLESADLKANTITAVTFGADKKQNGLMLVRVP